MKSILDHFPRIETRQLDDRFRSTYPGSYIRLPRGRVHYEIDGPEGGPLVLLVPGFSIPYYLWDPTFKALTRAGMRVLRYDLFGRGGSDRLRGAYDLAFFTRQISDLLYYLQIHEPLHLAGVSMGGPICLSFALTHLRDVKSVILIDPAGFPPHTGLFPKILQWPILGEAALCLQSRQAVEDGLSIDLYHPERFPEYVLQYMSQLRLRGSCAALLATIRSGILDRQDNLYSEFGKSGIPVQLIWGREDKTFPFEISEEVLRFLPHAEFHPIEHARHVPHYECPDIVNPLMVDFITNHK